LVSLAETENLIWFHDGQAALPLARRNAPDPRLRLFLLHALSARGVARRNRSTAAAPEVYSNRPSALDRIGGIAAIRSAIIDDCALARAVKRTGGASGWRDQ